MTEVNKQALQRTFARRYKAAKKRREKSLLLTEFCTLSGYHRKYAISLLRAGPLPQKSPRPRPPSVRRYGIAATKVLIRIWEVAGYPWSVRLKAILPLWLPSIRAHLKTSPEIETLLLAMSPRTMDRLLRPHKLSIKHRRYGRTKPGTLLKHHIHIKTDSWDVTEPGFVEVDTVAHCGNSGDGEFISSVNITDIHTTWTETFAVLGKGRHGVTAAIDEMRKALPFKLLGIDSDNGSEFINHHLYDYCKKNAVQFTRGRPYKKNDNAHIEQKNWTHVRKIFGWARFDSVEVLDAVNDLCRKELRLWMNFFQPNVKLLRKERIGSRLVRKYGKAQTPMDRLLTVPQVDEAKKAALQELRATLDPFVLAAKIEAKLDHIRSLANAQLSPTPRPSRQPFGGMKPAPDSYIPPTANNA